MTGTSSSKTGCLATIARAADVSETRTWTAPYGAGRLDRSLAQAFPDLSRARIQALIASGNVTAAGEPVKGSLHPEAGTVIDMIIPDVTRLDAAPEQLDVPILYEDEDLVVVYKPAGMVVHPSAGHSGGTLVNAMLAQADSLSGIGGVERPGIVHRLDGGTSGVMVVAKNDAAHQGLTTQFAAHTIDRRYLAMIHRVPRFDRGTFRSSLGRDPRDRMKVASVERGGRDAVTHWEIRARGDRVALVECRLETGRTHQVRVHLSEAGHPVVGDTMYGRRDCIAPAGIRVMVEALSHPLLHAFRLSFTHPRTGETITHEVRPPDDFLALCAAANLAVPAIG